MKDRTLTFLRCITPCSDKTVGKQKIEEQTAECYGELTQRDELTLVCQRCGTEYPVRSGVPHLLLSNITEGRYLDDAMIWTYYEMQFTSYISGTQLEERLTYPQQTISKPAEDDVQIESFAEVRQDHKSGSETLQTFYQSIDQLVFEQNLTEEFYKFMLNLSQPFIHPGVVVLDVGCGLGRMAVEVEWLGADHVIGLDLSPLMIEEAAKLINSHGRVPIKLTLVGGKTVSAQVELSWTPENCDFIVGNAQQLALQEEAFDLVLCLNLIDRVPEPYKVIKQIGRVLKTGGHLIITDPYDWKEGMTERRNWVSDMSVLFNSSKWQRVREIDGIPFVMRGRINRRIIIFMNHCLIYRKVIDKV